MPIHRQSYKFELMPNGAQSRFMSQHAGCCRLIYNQALAWNNEQYAADNKFKFNAYSASSMLAQWKAEKPFLRDITAHALQQVLKNLEAAFKAFFKKNAKYPKFKKKGFSDSFRLPDSFAVDQDKSRMRLCKIGWVRYRNSQKILGKVKNITVSYKCGKWFAAVNTEREVEQPVHPATSMVGVDVGVARLATLSNGLIFEAKNSFKQQMRKLARYQRALSRKALRSNNWKKQKDKISRLTHKIANIRKDYLHKTTSSISKNHAFVVVEDLKVSNMSKSAKGTEENPGRNVRAKSALNRSILDQGWYEFRRQLQYKLGWLGGQLLAINPMHTSQTCPTCNHVAKENRLVQDRFKCVSCGHADHADLVGAKNILAAGHAVLACGVAA